MHNFQTLNWVNQKKIFQETKQQNFYKIVVFTSFLYSHLAWLYCYILFKQRLDDKRFLAHKTIGNEFKATSISLSPNLLDGRAANFPLYGSQQNSNSKTLQRQLSAHPALPCPPSVIIQFSVRFAKQSSHQRIFVWLRVYENTKFMLESTEFWFDSTAGRNMERKRENWEQSVVNNNTNLKDFHSERSWPSSNLTFVEGRINETKVMPFYKLVYPNVPSPNWYLCKRRHRERWRCIDSAPI